MKRIVVGGMVLAGALVTWMLLTRSPFPDQDAPEAQAIRAAVLEYNEHVDERSVFTCSVNVLGFESVGDTPWKAYVALNCGEYRKIGGGMCLGSGGGGLDVYSPRSLGDRLEVVELIGGYSFGGGHPERFFPPDIAALISREDQRLWPPADDLQERAEALLFGEEAAERLPGADGEAPLCR